MSNHTTPRGAFRSRGTARFRLAAAVAVPLLAFSVACGGGDDAASDGSDGSGKGGDVASVPEEPTAKDAKDKGGKGGKGGDNSSDPAVGKSAFYDAQLTYVRCMRSKAGVPDFPDPLLSGYLDWPKIDEVVDPKGGGEEYKGGKGGVCFPEMEKALNLEPKRDQQKDYESMLAHAKCMRDKGVSKFTNPTMSGGRVMPGGDPSPGDPALDPSSPAYKQAREACRSKLLEGLDGMQ
ncbi:hypothetical protein GPA10_17895 [Streptomyces sp. p1417]|uniref:Lipoprotein n=1 Tax=Streptomyces typhae TaxID=2681492 RepID=A0A6L6WYJ8_9ACTN|nr:hypothetical protein [Streptomyces typhae]MVO86584.1 hypothetical protein [Streptomyces typhae]